MMNELYDWAIRNRISPIAISELMSIMTVQPNDQSVAGFGETAVQQRVRLETSKLGWRMARNNVGALPDGSVRWGLFNDTPQMNELIKSSDLIGIKPVRITPDHVGRTIGQFAALEVKKGGWQYKGTAHEQAQLRFITLVLSLGGYAKFVSTPEAIK